MLLIPPSPFYLPFMFFQLPTLNFFKKDNDGGEDKVLKIKPSFEIWV